MAKSWLNARGSLQNNIQNMRGKDLKLCRNVHKVRLYTNDVLLPLFMCFRCRSNLKVSLTYINGKSEIWYICCYLTADILTKNYRNVFLFVAIGQLKG